MKFDAENEQIRFKEGIKGPGQFRTYSGLISYPD